MLPSKCPVVVTVIIMLFINSVWNRKDRIRKNSWWYLFWRFGNDYFILHNNRSVIIHLKLNKVYPDIYAYQNGKILGNGIHSFHVDLYSGPGLISLQKDNKIEFIDVVNFISEGILEIEKPRDIFDLRGRYCMVSFGEKSTGGIAFSWFLWKENLKNIKYPE